MRYADSRGLSNGFLPVVPHRRGVSRYYRDAAEGYWLHDGKSYQDSLGLLVVDVPDTSANRKWMRAFKARWKERLDQIEIWMVSYRIDIE